MVVNQPWSSSLVRSDVQTSRTRPRLLQSLNICIEILLEVLDFLDQGHVRFSFGFNHCDVTSMELKLSASAAMDTLLLK